MSVSAAIPKLASIETFKVFAWFWVHFGREFILAEFGGADFLDMMYSAFFAIFAENIARQLIPCSLSMCT
jgi:hypothetical protein